MSPDPFRVQIRKALQNPALQAALDNNTERRKAAYSQAFASLPNAAAVRNRARQTRAEVIANLEGYVEQFVHHAQENGFHVHQAATLREALQVFLEIARAHHAKLVAKSKTMVSEEIGLNHALEAAGVRSVETDLGEFIVQLRGERPAHILTPAVHLRRAEVGQTFQQKLGVPFSDDVEVLTQIARAELRKVFLSADIGVSGVNFGIAETGMLCILTNEGNGRMVTTLPKVHIALMGLERIVPTMEALATMLQVLPRASSGQKITVYTSLIRSPRLLEDPDGPLERHLILLDNGRRALRNGPLQEALYCIRCGACLNACPVFREIGGHAYVGVNGQPAVYSGPIGSVISPGLFGSEMFANLAHASTLCGACREACPVGIDLPHLLLAIRSGVAQKPSNPAPVAVSWSLSWGLKFFRWLATSPRRFLAAQKLAAIAGSLFSGGSGWIRLPAFTGWGYARDLPQPARRTFRELFANRGAARQPQGSDRPFLRDQTPQSELHKADGEVALAEVPALTQAEQWMRFEQELTALGGKLIRSRREELSSKVAQWIREAGQGRVWTWEEAHLPEGLLKGLQDLGIEVHSNFDPETKVGLTGGLVAVAETGSVALTGGPGQPLLASLLPEDHLVVLHSGQICQTLAQALQSEAFRQAAAGVLISGPSRTGDIELTLTVGVHGPKRLVLFLLDENLEMQST